jgi:type II secretory pathway pseudopilin PulG
MEPVRIDRRTGTFNPRDERGIILVMSLVMMLVLVIIGYGLLVSTDGSTRAETGLKAQTAAFETADSGIEYAREVLRQCIAGTPLTYAPCNNATGTTLGAILNSYRNGSTLVDSTSLAGFPSTTGTANGTTNTPFVASNTSLLSPSAFQVFLTNDPYPTDGGVTSPTDTNKRATLTSFASGPNGIGYAVVQAVVEFGLDSLNDAFKGALILPGPDVNFDSWSSNNGKIQNTSPNCAATIAVTSNAARDKLVNGSGKIPPNKLDSQHYSTCLTTGGNDSNFGIYNFLPNSPYDNGVSPNPALPTGIPPASINLITISYYTQLLAGISQIATFRSTSDSGFTLGTTASPQVVYINGDFDFGPNVNTVGPPNDGAGVLVVTGNLTIHGNPTYSGLILAVGAGNVTFGGGGMGNFNGTMVVVNTTPWSTDARYVSSPTFNGNGGASQWGYSGNGENGVPFIGLAPPRRISFMQLR